MAEGLVAYAVLQAGLTPPPELRGPDGVRVEAVEEEGLALWVTRHHHAPAPGSAAAQTHHAVVAAALDTGVTPVPLRFGQWLDSPDAARRALRERAGEWHAALRRLAGTVELGVRAQVVAKHLAVRSVHARPTMGGREYMQALAERHAERRATGAAAQGLADALQRAGAAWIREANVELLETPPGWLSAAYLVERAHAASLREALRGVGREHTVERFAVTGPWPPYSFT